MSIDQWESSTNQNNYQMFSIFRTIGSYLPMGNNTSYPTRTIPTRGESIYTISLPNKSQIISICKSTIDVFNVDTNLCIKSVNTKNTLCASFNSDLNLIVVGDKDGSIYLYDATTLNCTQTVSIHQDSVTNILSIAPNIILSSSTDGVILSWSLETLQVVFPFPFTLRFNIIPSQIQFLLVSHTMRPPILFLWVMSMESYVGWIS
jgi:WD40 repeat protein